MKCSDVRMYLPLWNDWTIFQHQCRRFQPKSTPHTHRHISIILCMSKWMLHAKISQCDSINTKFITIFYSRLNRSKVTFRIKISLDGVHYLGGRFAAFIIISLFILYIFQFDEPTLTFRRSRSLIRQSHSAQPKTMTLVSVTMRDVESVQCI